MANIDVSFLCFDPDFASAIQVKRRASTVNNYGENQLTPTTIDAVGSVQPADGETMERLPEAMRSGDVISVYTMTRLYPDGPGTQYTDIVVWNGDDYQVKKCEPFGNYGAGYYKADCIRIDANG